MTSSVTGLRRLSFLINTSGVPFRMTDSLRPKGTVEVTCSYPGCDRSWWVGALDPSLPNGPWDCGANHAVLIEEKLVYAGGWCVGPVLERGSEMVILCRLGFLHLRA